MSLVVRDLIVAGAGVAFTVSKAEQSSRPVSAVQVAPAVENGQALFIAKGCLASHTNNRIETKYYEIRTDVGPNLTNY